MFFESVFYLLENEFVVAVFSLLGNFKSLIFFLCSVISFSYFFSFNLFVMVGVMEL